MANVSAADWAAFAAADWPSLQSTLARAISLSDEHDAASRAEYLCPPLPFAERIHESQMRLSNLLMDTAAAQVTCAIIPASGADASGAIAAFPLADEYTLVSREPPLRSLDQLVAELAHTTSPTAASLRALFACSHAGGYLLGHQLRPFAHRWGVLPPLLVSLHLAGVSVWHARRIRGGYELDVCVGALDAATPMDARARRTSHAASASVTSTAGCSHGGRHALVRYVSADLSDESNVAGVFERVRRWAATRRAHGGGRHVVGALLKGAEAALRGRGDAPSSPAQAALRAGLLGTLDVLLQDTQTGVPWRELQPWVHDARALVVPLGAYVESNLAESDSEYAAEAAAMRLLWEHSLQTGTWRSLRGVRFGYCQGRHSVSAARLAQRTPAHEVAASGENDTIEAGRPVYCAALLLSKPAGYRLPFNGLERVGTRA